MCEAMEKYAKEMVEEGRKEGLEKGRVEGRVIAYYSLDIPVDEISQKVGISRVEVEKIIAENC